MDEILYCFPHIAKKIFGNLDDATLKNCIKVSKSWRQFLISHKFFWTKITKGHPGWKELISSFSSSKVSNLGKSFLQIQEIKKKRNIHPILCAVYLDDVAIFKSLIQFWPESDVYNSKTQHLHFASMTGKYKIVQHIIENLKEGCKNLKNQSRQTALHFAAQNGHFRVVELLLSKIEGDKNPETKNGITPLHLASKNGYPEIVRILMANNPGKTQFSYANVFSVSIS